MGEIKEKGFSLLEVMIALTLFAFFATAFLSSQGYNVADSRLSEEQLILQQLAERKTGTNTCHFWLIKMEWMLCWHPLQFFSQH